VHPQFIYASYDVERWCGPWCHIYICRVS